jgi:hypothetical protein
MVGPIRSHSLYSVTDRQDACFERDLFALQPMGIAAAIPSFVMMSDQWRQMPQSLASLQEFSSESRVRFDTSILVIGEPPWLEQD